MLTETPLHKTPATGALCRSDGTLPRRNAHEIRCHAKGARPMAEGEPISNLDLAVSGNSD